MFVHNEDGAAVNVKISNAGDLAFCCTQCNAVWLCPDKMVFIQVPAAIQRRKAANMAPIREGTFVPVDVIGSHSGVGLGRTRARRLPAAVLAAESVAKGMADGKQIKMAKNLFPNAFIKSGR